MSKSIPRQVDKKSRVPEEEEGVWGSQGGKDKRFFPTFLSKDNITIMHPARGHFSPSWKSDQSCYLKMHIMGVGLVRSLQPWDILSIYCNNQLKGI